jgi:hypothetical protein
MLRLVAVDRQGAPVSTIRALWEKVLEISIRLEGVNAFTIDSTPEMGRRKRHTPEDEALLRSLGLEEHRHRGELLPLAAAHPILAEIGPRILDISLYADGDWVGGISDWADGIGALFDEEAYSQLMAAIQGLGVAVGVDVAEVTSRPSFQG